MVRAVSEDRPQSPNSNMLITLWCSDTISADMPQVVRPYLVFALLYTAVVAASTDNFNNYRCKWHSRHLQLPAQVKTNARKVLVLPAPTACTCARTGIANTRVPSLGPARLSTQQIPGGGHSRVGPPSGNVQLNQASPTAGGTR